MRFRSVALHMPTTVRMCYASPSLLSVCVGVSLLTFSFLASLGVEMHPVVSLECPARAGSAGPTTLPCERH